MMGAVVGFGELPSFHLERISTVQTILLILQFDFDFTYLATVRATLVSAQ